MTINNTDKKVISSELYEALQDFCYDIISLAKSDREEGNFPPCCVDEDTHSTGYLDGSEETCLMIIHYLYDYLEKKNIQKLDVVKLTGLRKKIDLEQ